MKHIIISRFKFSDKKLMEKYLLISETILIPALKAQKNKNFILALTINENDIDYVKNRFNFPFISFDTENILKKYVIENQFNIQTRHDIDDWMSNEYVDIIQNMYNENIILNDSFLIQSQPLILEYHKQIEKNLPIYGPKNNSMFLSLCQKNVVNFIFDRVHLEMHEICEKVLNTPDGHTKWIIHGDNISCRKGSYKL